MAFKNKTINLSWGCTIAGTGFTLFCCLLILLSYVYDFISKKGNFDLFEVIFIFVISLCSIFLAFLIKKIHRKLDD